MRVIRRKFKKLLETIFRAVSHPIFEENNDILLRKVARLQSIAILHQQTFSKFKGCNKWKNVAIVGAGPSLDKFIPIDNCLYVGLNSAVLFSKIKYDYLFTIDKAGLVKSLDQFCNYDCIKFVGDQNLGPKWQISESVVAKMKGDVLRYKTDIGLFSNSGLALDIDSQPLGNFNTVSLQALQFVLYTNPAKIYLVGIDCSNLGHFGNHDSISECQSNLSSRGEDLNIWARQTMDAWCSAKDFVDQYYPDTEIISVNPVGLRGLFKDLDQ